MMTVKYELEKKKKKIIYNPEASDNKATTLIVHERSIKVPEYFAPVYSVRSCVVHETFTEGKAVPDRVDFWSGNREMTQEEVEKFEQDWSNLWNPQAKLELD